MTAGDGSSSILFVVFDGEHPRVLPIMLLLTSRITRTASCIFFVWWNSTYGFICAQIVPLTLIAWIVNYLSVLFTYMSSFLVYFHSKR